ncbi:MAG: ATP-binding protein [Lachnospiraceae bacterium]|nr:ATP-binding protein [Lachnospiraceae bacterium]
MQFNEIPLLYIALAEWGACMAGCLTLPRRESNLKFALSSIVFLVFQCLFLSLIAYLPKAFLIPCIAVAVLAMYTFIFVTCDISLWKAVYRCAVSFLAAEFAASLCWQIGRYQYYGTGSSASSMEHSHHINIWSLLTVSILYTLIFGGLSKLGRRSHSDFSEFEVSWQEMLSVVLIVFLTFLLSNLSIVLPNTPFSGQDPGDILFIRTIVDFVGIVIIYAYEMQVTKMRTEAEVIRMESVLKMQYDQYRSYQDSIDMINIKYHDLKHQIQGMKAEADPEKRTEWIERLEKEVEAYRPEKETGNPVLDTIIAGKTPVIRNMDIQFTCVADGKLIGFMHVTDICTIFGNALDNALECLVQVPDADKRVLHFALSEKKGFVFALISNYCGEKLAFANGLPVTSKADTRYHGFGARSIREAAGKYGGSAVWTQKDDMLELKILIPKQ